MSPILMEGTTSTMPSGVTTAFQWLVNNVVTMVSIVTGDPVLSLGVAVWAAGATIGLFKRLV